jgi:5-hydroxyisourate hydrolase
MGKLSTHVLDTHGGKPAHNVRIDLYRITEDSRKLLKQERTNSDGRCNAPLLQGDELGTGTYELVFHAGDYFAAQGISLPSPRFVDQVAVRFGIAHCDQNYHVPLLVTPWSWSTYRGS